ncbi:PTS sugar transporter subunit IIC [uncultured Dubosiella sp.]|jgi:PTS system cellobiose-specific IIC component|uniref:PTS sugar transporter subunit IIC n=2 Tax=uncultured Dubosiella sp. TaxID=1937011 RepID=UPI0020854CCD|nr:PTS transporter subunit EIIC [uncultured Dubosiella sp.]GJM56885.1 permease IIC component [Erysipelotrichaceae bacterium OPF54]
MENNKTIDKVLEFAARFQANIYLDSISKGLMGTLPITMIGSIALLLAVLPIQAWKDFITAIGVAPYLLAASTLTTSCLSIYASFLIGYRLAHHLQVDEIPGGLISLFAFFIATPLTDGALTMSYMGAQGLFTALIASLLATRLYAALMKCDKLKIKMPPSVPGMIATTFSTMIPAILVGLIFIGIAVVFSYTPWGSFAEMIYSLVATPLMNVGGSIWSLVAIVLVQMILWFFGIHGSLVVGTVINAVYMPMALENMELYAAGTPAGELPHILGNTFYALYAGIGGAGGTLSLLIVMFLFAKAKQNKELAKLAGIPGIFVINEPIVFGYPLILNPVMAIPFILTPIVQLLIPYFVTAIGLIPPLTGVQVPFGLPVIVNGFMAGGWTAALMQIIDIAVGCLLWFPFFKISDAQMYKEEKGETMEQIAEEYEKEAQEA